MPKFYKNNEKKTPGLYLSFWRALTLNEEDGTYYPEESGTASFFGPLDFVQGTGVDMIRCSADGEETIFYYSEKAGGLEVEGVAYDDFSIAMYKE